MTEPTTLTTKGRNSRELIFKEALELFTKKGYDGTSIDDIRVAAGFKSKASFYTHFKSKEELASALLGKILEDEEVIVSQAYQAAPTEPLAQFLAIGRAFIEWGFTHPQEYAFCFLRIQQDILIRGSYSKETQQSNDFMTAIIAGLRSNYPVRQIADSALDSMLVGLISKAVIDQNSFGPLNLEEKVNQLIEMCLGILFTEKVL